MASTGRVNDAWNPEQYARFREERQQPFYDLLRLVNARKGMRVVDLGCGTGELTREMHRQLKAQTTLGIDSSDAMLTTTAEHNEPGLSFSRGRIEDFSAEGDVDLILSNAAIHWVPDHGHVLEQLHRALAQNGQLAIQMPMNRDAPDHVVCDALLREPPFAEVTGGVGVRQHTLPIDQYATLLWKLGFRQQHVRMIVYGHKMPSREGVLEWVQGALLTDVKKRMSQELFAEFLERYRERLLPLLHDAHPYLYTMKRVFLWAEK
jgi:trans-aconitate 2-methyltransferase